jgi:hypothetical protein
MTRDNTEVQEQKFDCDYDHQKVDEIVLALLHLTKHDSEKFGDDEVVRAWKGQDWDVLNRLHEKGYIGDPKSKAKSVLLTAEGNRLSTELFRRHFEKQGN